MELASHEIVAYCSENELSYVQFCNELMIDLAKSYLSGKVDYSYADGVANNIHDFMMSDSYLDSNNNTLDDPAYSVYLAFDAGEYYRKDDDRSIEPDIKYTKPELEKIVSEHESS
jgi:hypothetical protein